MTIDASAAVPVNLGFVKNTRNMLPKVYALLDILDGVKGAWGPDESRRPFLGQDVARHRFSVAVGMQDYDIGYRHAERQGLEVAISPFASGQQPGMITINGARTSRLSEPFMPASPDADCKDAVHRIRLLSSVLRGHVDRGVASLDEDEHPDFDTVRRILGAAAANAALRLGVPVYAEGRGPFMEPRLFVLDGMKETSLEAVEDAERRIHDLPPKLELIAFENGMARLMAAPTVAKVDPSEISPIELMRIIEAGSR